MRERERERRGREKVSFPVRLLITQQQQTLEDSFILDRMYIKWEIVMWWLLPPQQQQQQGAINHRTRPGDATRKLIVDFYSLGRLVHTEKRKRVDGWLTHSVTLWAAGNRLRPICRHLAYQEIAKKREQWTALLPIIIKCTRNKTQKKKRNAQIDRSNALCCTVIMSQQYSVLCVCEWGNIHTAPLPLMQATAACDYGASIAGNLNIECSVERRLSVADRKLYGAAVAAAAAARRPG